MYRVIVERSAEKDLRRLPLDMRFRVANALRNLANNPHPVGSRKLAGTKHDWRIRVGDYRVNYEIADSIRVVRVYRVRHRREVLPLMLSAIRIPLSEIVRCGPQFCSMKITEDVRRYALEQGVTEEAAIERGLHEKAKEFQGTGTEIYAKR